MTPGHEMDAAACEYADDKMRQCRQALQPLLGDLGMQLVRKLVRVAFANGAVYGQAEAERYIRELLGEDDD